MGIIRFILALAVIAAHSTFIFGLNFGSNVAVDCFFVISGFYMAMILSEKYVGKNSSYWLYLSNRLLRLYPIYIVILILTLAANLYGLKHGNSPKLTLLTSLFQKGEFPVSGFILYVFSSIAILFQDVIPNIGVGHGYLFFMPGDPNSTLLRLNYFNFVPQGWSLGSELFFYLLAPIIVKQSNFRLVIGIALCIAFRVTMANVFGYPLWNQIFFPSVLPFFLMGIFSYRLYRVQFFAAQLDKLRNRASWFLPIFILFLTTDQLFTTEQVYNAMYPVVFALFIPFIFYSSKKKKWDAKIGELSYPMYLSHLLISMVFKALSPNPTFHTGITVTIASVIFSIALIRLISDPVEKMRQKRVRAKTEQVAQLQ